MAAIGPAPLPSIGLLLPTTTFDAGVFSVNRSDGGAYNATQLRYGRKLTAAYGTFALNGQDATLTEDETASAINAAPLPIWGELTLQASGAYVLVAEFGGFSSQESTNASLVSTMLRKGRALIAEAGIFGASGAPAERDMELNGDYRQFVTIGFAAGMSATRTLPAAYGAFALNGQQAGGTRESAGNYLLDAGFGVVYAFGHSRDSTGPSPDLWETTFVRGYAISCEPGTFTVDAQSVTLDGPTWRPTTDASGSWVYVTPSGGVWTDVDPDS